MREFHERLTRVGLIATEGYGFALAGGYALSANGFGDRPSMDVDLFTNDLDPVRFACAVAELMAEFENEGLNVRVLTQGELFVNLDVHDLESGERSEMQLGWDFREFPPTTMSLGPVLNERDAVANKMTALYGRGEVRDYIDIDTVIMSGAFSRDDILALADTREAQPLDRGVLAQRFAMLADSRQERSYGPAQFARYGVNETERRAIVKRFTQWAADLEA